LVKVEKSPEPVYYRERNKAKKGRGPMPMKRRIFVILTALATITAITPVVSRAAVEPYFIAINDTLLEFSDDTMPYINGGDILIPVRVFEEKIPDDGGLKVYAIGSDKVEQLRLYQGIARYVDFTTTPGRAATRDQNGYALDWPPARRIDEKFYVPLKQVCGFFDLSYEIYNIRGDIIPAGQVQLIRIVSNAKINTPTFEGLNRNAIKEMYDRYYAPPEPSPSQPSLPTAPPAELEILPDYSKITVHLSFYDISAGSTEGILDLLEIQAAFGYKACFFVSYADIASDPGLVRKIAGSGHSIGINLPEGTYEEYLKTSALLFEAAKIKTVLVRPGREGRYDRRRLTDARARWLMVWEDYTEADFYDTLSGETITDAISREEGSRQNIMLSCSDGAASALPGIIFFLKQNGYAIERISETVKPVGR